MPIFISLLNELETKPTIVGPNIQPISPPNAKRANITFPPLLIDAEAELQDPGHNKATPIPEKAIPIKEIIGFLNKTIVK